MEIELYKYYLATFNPKITNDLKLKAINVIGKTLMFEASWIIEDGKYKGQYAMYNSKVGWCPLEDLDNLKEG